MFRLPALLVAACHLPVEGQTRVAIHVGPSAHAEYVLRQMTIHYFELQQSSCARSNTI